MPLFLFDMDTKTNMTETQAIKDFESIMKPVLHLLPNYILYDLENNGFFTAPASTRYHGNYKGGLFDHSYNVTKALIMLTSRNDLKWSRVESPYIVGMFHDLCKIDQYKQYDSIKWIYNPDAVLKGHGEKSVMLLSQYLPLTMEEILCIRYHMGAFTDQKEWDDYTRAIHLFETVLWTHHADMIATHVMEVNKD